MTMKHSFAGAAVMLGVLVLAQAAASEGLPVGPDLADAGWTVLTVPETAATQFSGRPDGATEVTATAAAAAATEPPSWRARPASNSFVGTPVAACNCTSGPTRPRETFFLVLHAESDF